MRVRGEQGTTVVVVALCMTVLMGMGAIAIDYSSGARTKVAADGGVAAAARSVAVKCALLPGSCTNGSLDSGALATTKSYAGVSSQTVSALTGNSTSVTVTASGTAAAPLAASLGFSSQRYASQASANWASVPLKGPVAVPIGIGYCDWKANQPNSTSIVGPTYTFRWDLFWLGWASTSCTGVPGSPATTASNASGAGLWLSNGVVPGFNLASCDYSPSLWDSYQDFLDNAIEFRPCMRPKLLGVSIGDTVLFPIYAKASFWGFATSLWIVGFAPFKITAFVPPWPFTPPTSCDIGLLSPGGLPLFGNCVGITGTFVRTTRPFTGWKYGSSTGDPTRPAVNLGAVKVSSGLP